MFDLNFIYEFSRNHCVTVCAFLVPANLIATSATLLLLYFQLKKPLIFTTSIASLAASALFLHISTWLMIGVLNPVSFILLILGSTCLAINCWAILHPQSDEHLTKIIDFIVKKILRLKNTKKNVFTN